MRSLHGILAFTFVLGAAACSSGDGSTSTSSSSTGTGGMGGAGGAGCSTAPTRTPKTLATLPAGANGRTLALVGGNFYVIGAAFANDGKSVIYSAPVAGGAVSQVAVNDPDFYWYGPPPVAAAVGFYSFTSMFDLVTRPFAGGATTKVGHIMEIPATLAIDAARSRVSWGDSGAVHTLPTAGGAATTFCMVPGTSLEGLYDDGQNSMFFTAGSFGNLSLQRCDKGGAPATIAAYRDFEGPSITADDTYVYWTDTLVDDPSSHGLYRAPRAGGAEPELIDGAGYGLGVMIPTPEGLVWSRSGTILRLAKGQSPTCPETLATFDSAGAFDLDAKNIYVLAGDTIAAIPR
jgi:hypothetical protein